MILVGQYDSPFVRRVAVALNYFGMEFDRRILSTFQDLDEMLAVNPLGKVPALILPGGVSLWESRAIIEYLEGITTSHRRLTPTDEMDWLTMLRVEAVGIGLADKTYERSIEFSRRSPGTQDPIWIERLERQIDSALIWLDGMAESEWLVGDAITRADLAVVVATTYVVKKQPKLHNAERFPRLEAHRQRCEGAPLFSAAAYSEAEALATGWRPEPSQ